MAPGTPDCSLQTAGSPRLRARAAGRGSGEYPNLLARVLLGGLLLELEADEALVAEALRVVPRPGDIRLPRTQLEDRPVVVRHAHPARLHDAHVPVLAAVRSRDRL